MFELLVQQHNGNVDDVVGRVDTELCVFITKLFASTKKDTTKKEVFMLQHHWIIILRKAATC